MSLANMPNISWDTLKSVRIDNKQTRIIIGITAATALLYSTYKLFSSPDPFKNKKGLKEIPIPDGSYPYVGHILTLGKGFAKATMDWHKRYGPILHVLMGIQHWIFIDDPYLAHHLFVTNGAVCSNRPGDIEFSKILSHEGRGVIVAPYGHYWKKTRNAALSILLPKKVEVYADEIDSESDALVERLISCSEKDGGVFPLPHLEFNSLNFISAALFGIRFTSVDDPEYQEMANISATTSKLLDLGNDLSSFLPILASFNLFKNTTSVIKDFVDNVRDPVMIKLMDEAQKRDGPNLVKEVREDNFDLDIKDEIVFFSDLLLGGTDTTSATLAWIIAIMCHHIDAQDRLHEELRKFTQKHGRLPRFEERKETPLASSAIRECMRYKPVFNFNIAHTNTEEVEVDGYYIPKNSKIIVSMDSINRNPRVYSSPDEFILDRFIDNDKTMMASANGKPEERDHYTFGWGRRLCPGIYLAEMEIYSAFTRIFSQCVVEPADTLPNLDKEDKCDVICIPRSYKARFTRRT
ncbi:cytochrome P450 [Pilobolus umbonatus]|nr:cytochrome P450 [Pilobolus umbonatus]